MSEQVWPKKGGNGTPAGTRSRMSSFGDLGSQLPRMNARCQERSASNVLDARRVVEGYIGSRSGDFGGDGWRAMLFGMGSSAAMPSSLIDSFRNQMGRRR
jgi:hypothetical protein